MIVRHDLLALNFYKKAAFTGSSDGMRYRVEKIELPVEDSEDTIVKLQASIWPEPFSYANTDPDKIIRHEADFSEEGLVELVDWMNEEQKNFIS